MSRDRGLTAVGGVAIKVVPSAMSNQDTPRRFKLADKDLAFHTSNSTGCRWAVGGADDRS